MLKLYEEQTISLYKMQKDLGISKYTLYRYAKGERNIESMDVLMFKSIADYLKMGYDELYEKIKEYQDKKRRMKK